MIQPSGDGRHLRAVANRPLTFHQILLEEQIEREHHADPSHEPCDRCCARRSIQAAEGGREPSAVDINFTDSEVMAAYDRALKIIEEEERRIRRNAAALFVIERWGTR